MKKWVVLAIFVSIVASVAVVRGADDPKCAQLVADSERLWLARDFDGSDKVIAEAMKLCPKMAELYWRKARNDYDRIELIPRNKKPSKDQLIARYRTMERQADQCIALAPNDGCCYQWKGIAMGRRGTTQGVLSSLKEAPDLERAFLKAEKLAPQYRAENGTANALGDTYDGLGQFYRVVPEWLCTFGIKQIVGVCGDLKKSVAYHRKAVAREPKRIEYQKDLAVALLCYGQKHDDQSAVAEGKKILAALQALPNVKYSDPIDKEHAKMLLQNPDLACGYSRDAQQEQSQSAYQGPK